MRQLLQKYKELNAQTRAAFWFTMCSFLQRGISFITVPIFTRLLSTEQYGTYTLYLSWLQILTVLSSLYLYYGVTDNAMSKFDKDRSRFISSMQGLTITVTTCALVLCLLLKNRLQRFMGLSSVLIALMFLEMYVTPALAFWSARQRFEYRYKRLVAVTLAKSVLNPCVSLAAVYLAQDKALARIASSTLVEAAFCGTILVYQFAKGRCFFDRAYWKYALVLAVPMLPHYLSGVILNHGDRIMIENMVGRGEVALYGVAYNIGMLVQIFVNSINNAMTPWVYDRLKVSDIASIRNRSRGILVFVVFIAVGLMLISPEVVLVFGSSKYRDSVYVIPPVAGSVFFIFLYSFLSFPEFYYEKTYFLMIASLVSAGLNIVLNYIFIPRYGFVAAAYTTLACYVVYSLGHYIVGSFILRRKTGERSIVDEKIMAVLAVLLILASSLAYLLFPWIVLRYCIIAAGLVAAFIKRESILALLRAP